MIREQSVINQQNKMTALSPKAIWSIVVLVSLSTVFWVAAATKITHLSMFWDVLETVPFLPASLIVPASGVVIAAEVLIPFGLLTPYLRRQALIASTVLLGVFLLYSFYRIALGQTGACGCFVGVLNLTSVQDVLLDSVLLSSALSQLGLRLPFADKAAKLIGSMSGPDRLLVSMACTAALGITGWTYVSRSLQADPKEVQVAASELIPSKGQFEGDVESPLTLVMFMDYQCPPCKRTHQEIKALIAKYPGQVRVVYRHLPLTSIHPFAYDAALTVEAARIQGQYWAAHKMLLESDLSKMPIKVVAERLRLDVRQFEAQRKTLAQKAVQLDAVEAEKLGLSGTPSMFAVTKNGKAYAIRDIEQFKRLL